MYGEREYNLILEDRKSWVVNYVPDMENLLVYFDFELADSRYVPTLLIAKAPVVNVKTNAIRFWPLIDHCDATLMPTIDGVPLRGIPPADFLHFDEETRCPPTFYKNILYTRYGRRIRTFYDVGEPDPEEDPRIHYRRLRPTTVPSSIKESIPR
jgi:hypothetical protein